jgi:hypothetical protein
MPKRENLRKVYNKIIVYLRMCVFYTLSCFSTSLHRWVRLLSDIQGNHFNLRLIAGFFINYFFRSFSVCLRRCIFIFISYLIKEFEFEFWLFLNIFEVMGFTWILFRVLSIKTSKTKRLKKHQHFSMKIRSSIIKSPKQSLGDFLFLLRFLL